MPVSDVAVKLKPLSVPAAVLESATLREITPRKDRVIHRTKSTDRTWLDEMVRYFGIEFDKKDSRYTEEELETLKNVVNTYRACKDDYEL